MADDEQVPVPKKKPHQIIHERVKQLTESGAFNGGIMFIIVVNALFIAFEADESTMKKWGKEVFKIADNIFLAIYSAEFILKFYAEPKNYWRSTYNIFDILVLLISFAQGIMEWSGADTSGTNLGALRVLRALRTLRMLRTVSFIRGLQVS